MQDVLSARRRDLADSSIATYALQFSHILPAEFLHGLSVSKRIRQYCNVVVFWAWIAQIFETNASLSKAVSLVQAWCDDAGLPVPNKDTGSFSRGRGRLPLKFLTAVNSRINDHLNTRIQPEDTYQGHIIKSIDGSSMSLDDTEENQSEYPQPSSQGNGCGFPVMGIMGVLNHAHGGWEDFVEGEQSAHDAPIYRKLLHCFHPGDILCGDRAFCTYELMSTLDEQQVHTLMRLHQARHRVLDWRRGKKIDNHQRLVVWKKPSQKPSGSPLTSEEWAALPDEMEVRLIRFYFEDRDGKKRRMVLATTLTDHEKYDWQDLAAIYAQRWDIELRLRDIKTTLKMDHLRVKTPETARKSLRMALIAYNLIKSGCQEAAHSIGKDLRLMSFKGALDTIVSNTARYLRRQRHVNKIREIWTSTIGMIAEKVINFRPFRREPRAQKKRPKNFSYLTVPRAEYKESPHRGKSRALA
ncbi:MAG: IS4 family transposase [Haloferula sp.]